MQIYGGWYSSTYGKAYLRCCSLPIQLSFVSTLVELNHEAITFHGRLIATCDNLVSGQKLNCLSRACNQAFFLFLKTMRDKINLNFQPHISYGMLQVKRETELVSLFIRNGRKFIGQHFEIPNTHETLTVLSKILQRNILKNKNLVRQFRIFFMVQVMPQKSKYEIDGL